MVIDATISLCANQMCLPLYNHRCYLDTPCLFSPYGGAVLLPIKLASFHSFALLCICFMNSNYCLIIRSKCEAVLTCVLPCGDEPLKGTTAPKTAGCRSSSVAMPQHSHNLFAPLFETFFVFSLGYSLSE